ncbi:hypothetical protein [Abyssalbus ytuae]|uniref:Uncharacterized protein n=1 Tax=Abyssalbus ytuae TaxID=2926907 RepID=A0A9E6ZJ53_9FLAO|nr:hypothetical protein [Abyssalbus ytuae]UOB16517.1 hypothetical protein MQE35_12310 [Abyssalbus ytuae]
MIPILLYDISFNGTNSITKLAVVIRRIKNNNIPAPRPDDLTNKNIEMSNINKPTIFDNPLFLCILFSIPERYGTSIFFEVL